jgi:hypothetical protein
LRLPSIPHLQAGLQDGELHSPANKGGS